MSTLSAASKPLNTRQMTNNLLPYFRVFFTTLLVFGFAISFAQPTDIKEDALESHTSFPEPDCYEDPCPCDGGITVLKLYYFGEDNVDIEVYGNNGLTNLITSFVGVNKGDLIVIDGTGLPAGKLYSNTYLRVTNGLGETCVTKIFSRCPTNSWPGALEDLKIVGKDFADFTVYAITDEGNNVECTVDDIDQDWHVGGNIVGPTNNTLGTRNNENVTLITNDTPRGVITTAGNFGINTQTPSSRLHVDGDVIVEETLDVNGIARMNSGDGSTSPADGALVVTGGTGISENLNVGNDASVGNDANVGNDLSVTQNAGIGNDLDVGNNAFVGNLLSVFGDARVLSPTSSTSPLTGALTVFGGVGIGENLEVAGNGNVEGDFSVGSSPATQITMSAGFTGNAISSEGGDLFLNTVSSNLLINTQAGNGKVAIGTVNIPNAVMGTDVSGYKLFVQGGILTEEVRVRTDWADYVFADDYQLRSLAEVKSFIEQNGHLPGTPSAQEIQDKGLELASTATLQQEKIEELFLYVISLDEKIKALEAENAELKALLEQK
ncbi:MAG: hypothetical protein DWQ02_26930 [Bacteroidetes bacterium]|nr:MAG: hypothetical protein DWQ02_26930 [Bacteroidota bacterium]